MLVFIIILRESSGFFFIAAGGEEILNSRRNDQLIKKERTLLINPEFIALIVFLLAVSIVFTAYMWNYSIKATENEAVQMIYAVESGFQKSLIEKLNADINDINRAEYKEIKSSLINMAEIDSRMESAYIFTQKNGRIYYLADSRQPDSEGYMPPGQEFEKASDDFFNTFQNGQSMIIKPVSDSRGRLISVLVPMKNMETGEVIAVLGVDYLQGAWKKYAVIRTVQVALVCFCMLLISAGILFVITRNKACNEEKKKLQDMERQLRESERSKAVLLSHLPGMAYRCKYDRNWTMLFVSEGCFDLTGYKPESLLNNKELSYNQLIVPEYRDVIRREWERVVGLRLPFRYEYEITCAGGERKWVLEMGQGIYEENGEVKTLEGIIIDITESKQRLMQVQYLNDHDPMTGLYNHRFFEEAKFRLDRKECLPLSIITADINGIRLINDAFGHAEGDRMIIETAKIIQGCCRDGDVLARTGGDEFRILLPNTDWEEAYKIVNEINRACERHNNALKDKSRSINLSVGYGTKTITDENIKVTEKEAEDYMYRHKLLEQNSYYSAILSSTMATMYVKSQETEEHAQRLAELSKMIGRVLNLQQKSMDELELFAMLHDIGKIGIDDRILNKPGKLSDEEWEVMKRHPEIGYRIARSSPELAPVAEYILTHHEHWDGNGYPKGLKGENIPLLSRILAVADAYDAMTEDRVYRKALTREQAIEEIRKNAGTQFDPNIVQIFIEHVYDKWINQKDREHDKH